MASADDTLRPSLKGRRALVTGASGFIGAHLVARLRREGAEVHAVSRRRRDDASRVRWWRADLSCFREAQSLVEQVRPEIVFHLAGYPVGARDARHVVEAFQANLASTVHLLAAAHELHSTRLLIAGSLEEPDGDEAPSSPYAMSKWASASYARMFHRLYGASVVNLRIFMAYGPGHQDEDKLIPYTIRSLQRGESPQLSSGRRQVDWVYVDDVVEGILAAAVAKGIDGSTVDLGSGRLVSVREVAERVAELVGSGRLELGALSDRSNEVVRCADLERSFRLTGWSPRYSLGEGLKRTVRWFDANRLQRNSATARETGGDRRR